MSIEGDTSNRRAPAERNVYSNAESLQIQSPSGAVCVSKRTTPVGRASCPTPSSSFESRFIGAERNAYSKRESSVF